MKKISSLFTAIVLLFLIGCAAHPNLYNCNEQSWEIFKRHNDEQPKIQIYPKGIKVLTFYHAGKVYILRQGSTEERRKCIVEEYTIDEYNRKYKKK